MRPLVALMIIFVAIALLAMYLSLGPAAVSAITASVTMICVLVTALRTKEP